MNHRLLLRSIRRYPRPITTVRNGHYRLNSTQTPHSSPQKDTLSASQATPKPVTATVGQVLARLLGLTSPKRMVGMRTLRIYEQCARAPEASQEFWQKKCDLPPTFQSWFTVTNLYVWILTVRYRALPPPYGKLYIQALVDHFFIDTEHRIRAILQPHIPPLPPYTFHSEFYVNPNVPADGKIKRGMRAPERLVGRQMKIFKEQWMGMTMSLDLGLIGSDAELAAAVWRNLLGARGANGIAYPGSSASSFRRSVNLVGGEVENPDKVDLDKEEARDDGSGVHDYPPDEIDKYVKYPELMLQIVTDIRRKVAKMESISDEDLMRLLPTFSKIE
ncbi:ubiquinol cytochrome-c reductase assembly protein cbp3 [Moniliophthora roreri MCA 2997]|uniref:Ubiquinol cytochrome-c reductase assembly protein cbp3 n=1 Tax=Moniliophthora roreri (strain MCA 2997) TaxID=1381753 RepID=V2XS81_MONRO|nr:ubiquinol cytochrome-c reductase assembly protein cbp3 [Moniliophthora roreri MCA 2997]